jgi:hypothetical protein
MTSTTLTPHQQMLVDLAEATSPDAGPIASLHASIGEAEWRQRFEQQLSRELGYSAVLRDWTWTGELDDLRMGAYGDNPEAAVKVILFRRGLPMPAMITVNELESLAWALSDAAGPQARGPESEARAILRRIELELAR